MGRRFDGYGSVQRGVFYFNAGDVVYVQVGTPIEGTGAATGNIGAAGVGIRLGVGGGISLGYSGVAGDSGGAASGILLNGISLGDIYLFAGGGGDAYTHAGSDGGAQYKNTTNNNNGRNGSNNPSAAIGAGHNGNATVGAIGNFESTASAFYSGGGGGGGHNGVSGGVGNQGAGGTRPQNLNPVAVRQAVRRTSNTALLYRLILLFRQTTYDPGAAGTWMSQAHTSYENSPTPAFNGDPSIQHLQWYVFEGWSTVPSPTVTGDITCVAQWIYDPPLLEVDILIDASKFSNTGAYISGLFGFGFLDSAGNIVATAQNGGAGRYHCEISFIYNQLM